MILFVQFNLLLIYNFIARRQKATPTLHQYKSHDKKNMREDPPEPVYSVF